jgi:hypothetical protein
MHIGDRDEVQTPSVAHRRGLFAGCRSSLPREACHQGIGDRGHDKKHGRQRTRDESSQSRPMKSRYSRRAEFHDEMNAVLQYAVSASKGTQRFDGRCAAGNQGAN